jgi:hypothetical protein
LNLEAGLLEEEPELRNAGGHRENPVEEWNVAQQLSSKDIRHLIGRRRQFLDRRKARDHFASRNRGLDKKVENACRESHRHQKDQYRQNG